MTIFITFLITTLISPVFAKNTCDNMNELNQFIEEQKNIVAVKKDYRDDELRQIYQSKSVVGVAATIFEPSIFKGKVMMMSLAYECNLNLREFMETPVEDKLSQATYIESWQTCVNNLYSNQIPPPAKTVLTCMKRIYKSKKASSKN